MDWNYLFFHYSSFDSVFIKQNHHIIKRIDSDIKVKKISIYIDLEFDLDIIEVEIK